jgi:hypothetical protein
MHQRGTRRRRILGALGATALTGVAVPLAIAAAGSPAPSVTLAKLPSTVTPGQKLSITGTAHAGSQGTGTARFTFALSHDAKLSAGDLRIGSLKVKPIAAHKSRKVSVRLAVPASAATGSYRLLACDKGKKPPKCRSLRSVTVRFGNGVFPDSIRKSLRGITPHPRSVTPHTDDAHAVTGVVTAGSGGTLNTTGADGTQYTLSVPAGAVLSDLTLTMTPLSSVDGLGMSGGFVGGVQMNPDGVELLKPAKLTIVPRGGAPASGLTAAVYEGNGANFGLVPRDPGSGLSFELTHFSGGVVGSATSGDLATQQNHAPAGTADQFRQLSEHGNSAALRNTFNQYYNDVIKPKLIAALDDESLAPGAIQEAVGALRQMEILGFDVSSTNAEVFKYIVQILKNAYNRSYDRCVKNHAPSEAIQMLGHLRMLTIFGAGDEVDASKVPKCIRFKLDYQVDFTHGQPGSLNSETMGVESLGAQLEYDMSQNALTGSLPLTVTHYTFSNYNCNGIDGGTTTVKAPGTARVAVDPQITRLLTNGHVVTLYSAKITLLLDHGTIEVTHNCASPPDNDPSFYHGMWHSVFPDLEQNGANGPSTLGPPLWSYLGGATWAKTNLDLRTVTTPGDTKTGNLRFTLYHTPAG